ncbi:hypothetical protein FOXB_16117 [Fusarium oxysporum f. sp. conglutinans Fo5176]|uniref:Uncharacterized protein n=1 Tax=Fusarium oxysporum (strain Fo5176) TaxID=660025 RepID=F9GBT4_FUSOF|nr:hypothetical protein FOXB_16117 [Fusarium oxysporum f. sp. conglutinans Fo5176]
MHIGIAWFKVMAKVCTSEELSGTLHITYKIKEEQRLNERGILAKMRWEKKDSSITGIVGGWTTAAGRQESRPRRHGAGLAICNALDEVGFEEQEGL